MDKPLKERRKYIRIYRNFILSYHQKGNPSATHEVSQVNNVSKGGLCFSSTQPLKQGRSIIINLKTPFISDSISVEGVVLECKEKITDMIYEVRLQFQEVPRQVLTVLEKIETYSKVNEN